MMNVTPQMVAELISLEERISRLETLEFGAAGGGAFVKIAEATVVSGVITISSIPTGYRHLFFVFVGNTDDAGVTNDYVLLELNGDTTVANYISGESANMTAVNYQTGYAGMMVARVGAANRVEANDRGSCFGFLGNYDHSDVYKPMMSYGGTPQLISGVGVEGVVAICSGIYKQNTVISSMKFKPLNGTNLVTGATVWLYGLGSEA